MSRRALWPKGCSCPLRYDCAYRDVFRGPSVTSTWVAVMECGNYIDVGRVNSSETFEWNVPTPMKFDWTSDPVGVMSDFSYKKYTMIRFFFNGSLEWVDGSEGTEFL